MACQCQLLVGLFRGGSAIVFWLLLLAEASHGWILPDVQVRRRTSFVASKLSTSTSRHDNSSSVRLKMIVSDLFGGSNKNKKPSASTQPSLPRDVKAAVSNCRESVQDALQKRISRMDVDFPVGTKFGVEKENKKQKKLRQQQQNAEGGSAAPTRQELDTSDRELARLFVDMFQPVGGDRISVVFPDTNTADAAKKRWKGDSTAKCRVLAMDRRRKSPGGGSIGKKKKKTKAKGFAAKLAAEIEDESDESGPFQLPEDTEVALFVAPGPKELVVVERICEAAGMGTLVVLLNARLALIEKFGSQKATELFRDEFQTVFCLSAAPQESAPGCLLYRAYPGEYVLARKPKVGAPKTIATYGDTRPTSEECRDAYDNMEELSNLEQGVENVVENVANWFR